jgi:hypothetical protein
VYSLHSFQVPSHVILGGALSSLQLETVCYAGMRHSRVGAGGSRLGFFLGDGAGVGKVRWKEGGREGRKEGEFSLSCGELFV